MCLLLLVVSAGCSQRVDQAENVGDIAQAVRIDKKSPIGKKWAKLGGFEVVGDARSEELEAPGHIARYQSFSNGVIVSSDDFGAKYMTHEIFDKWISLGSSTTFDGTNLLEFVVPPTKDVKNVGTHKDSEFERGLIIQQGTDTWVVYGEIYKKFIDFKGELGQRGHGAVGQTPERARSDPTDRRRQVRQRSSRLASGAHGGTEWRRQDHVRSRVSDHGGRLPNVPKCGHHRR